VVEASVPNAAQPIPQLAALERAGCKIDRRHPPRLLQRLRDRALPAAPNGWLRRFRPDHLVISTGFLLAGDEWIMACRQLGIPCSIIVHLATGHLWPPDGRSRRLAEAYEHAMACYFVSNANLELARKQLCTPLHKARIVRNPFLVSYDAALPWPDEETYRLACVARLDIPHKGQDILFEVMRQPKWRARPLKITLFGNGPYRDVLRSIHDLYQLDNVEFGGFVHGIEAVWRTYHGLVLSSRWEGLPLAVVEAMLCGRVCILTDVGGNTEMMEDGVTGFVAAAPTASLFDEALERAWQNRESWQSMGQEAARRVREMVPRDPASVFAEEILSHLAAVPSPTVVMGVRHPEQT
jgi:glycosyltransferase involved in cell wall biosynthesis